MGENKTDSKGTGSASAATRAKNKYKKKNYDRMELTLPKGLKEIITQIASGEGKSNNAYVIEAITEKMEREEKSGVNNIVKRL